MILERDYEIDFPAIHVPESRTFAYRTRLGNWGSVETECVLMREKKLDA